MKTKFYQPVNKETIDNLGEFSNKSNGVFGAEKINQLFSQLKPTKRFAFRFEKCHLVTNKCKPCVSPRCRARTYGPGNFPVQRTQAKSYKICSQVANTFTTATC